MLVQLEDDPQVVAVIPTLGTDLPRLGRCIEALKAQTSSTRFAVVIVLNTGDDPKVDRSITSVAAILRPGLNLGWAGGLQLGRVRAATADHLWLVQDDMTPEPDCLAELEAELRADPRLAIVSPLVIDDSGMVPAGSCGGVLRREPSIDMDHWYPGQATATDELAGLDSLDYVPSRGMLVDLAIWDRVGGMFAGYYPVLWADVDLCTAVKEAGRRFGIARKARTRHDGQGSTPSPFGRLLYERHRDLYRTRWETDARESSVERSPLPQSLAETVAIASASLASDLAASYTSSMDDAARASEAAAAARAAAAAAEAEVRLLRSSTSWRFTRPLRALGRLVRRR